MNQRGGLRSRWTSGVLAILVGIISPLLVIWLVNVGLGTSGSTRAREWVLAFCLLGLGIVGYIAWPSRWNVISHTNLVFGIVAYLLPIIVLHELDGMSSVALETYYNVTVLGLLFTVFGVFIGMILAGRSSGATIVGFPLSFTPESLRKVQRASVRIGWIAVCGVLLSYAVMGFIPAFADDPLSAKFFRGAYAASYEPVAPLYRAATSILSLLFPILISQSFRSRKALIVSCAGVAVVLLSLTRGPAVTGALIVLGLLFAVRRLPLVGYFGVLLVTYFIGSAFYYLLGKMGVEAYSTFGGGAFLDAVAAGSPDVSDQLAFLNSWVGNPEYTYGRTWWGGLVPSQYQWNPAVWTLHIVNPGQDIDAIASGGLRLSDPIWGLVSFGWPGVVGVSVFSGIAEGYVMRRMAQLPGHVSLVEWSTRIVVCTLFLGTVGAFVTLSYVAVFQCVVLWMLLRNARRSGVDARRGGDLRPRLVYRSRG